MVNINDTIINICFRFLLNSVIKKYKPINKQGITIVVILAIPYLSKYFTTGSYKNKIKSTKNFFGLFMLFLSLVVEKV
jgi:hypothetical protein